MFIILKCHLMAHLKISRYSVKYQSLKTGCVSVWLSDPKWLRPKVALPPYSSSPLIQIWFPLAPKTQRWRRLVSWTPPFHKQPVTNQCLKSWRVVWLLPTFSHTTSNSSGTKRSQDAQCSLPVARRFWIKAVLLTQVCSRQQQGGGVLVWPHVCGYNIQFSLYWCLTPDRIGRRIMLTIM